MVRSLLNGRFKWCDRFGQVITENYEDPTGVYRPPTVTIPKRHFEKHCHSYNERDRKSVV